MTYEYAFWYLLGVCALIVTGAKTNGFDCNEGFAIAIALWLIWTVTLLLWLGLFVTDRYIEWRKA